MLFFAKSFCLSEINHWPLLSKNFNLPTQKLKQVEQWKVAYLTRVNCQYLAEILSYIEDSSFRIILKRRECLLMPNLFSFLR